MPKPQERRAIEHFINQYNQFGTPKISSCKADLFQESPDAILTLSDNQRVALEHTSAYPPKNAHVTYRSPLDDLSPVESVLDRKFRNHYRGEDQDQSWLLMQIRPTLPLERVIDVLQNKEIPPNFDAVFLQWPILHAPGNASLGLYELRSQQLWLPSSKYAA